MKKRKLMASVLAGLLAVVMGLGMIPSSAQAASSSEIRKQLNKLKEEKSEIAAQIKQIKGQYNANADEIDDLVSQKNGKRSSGGYQRHRRHRSQRTCPQRGYPAGS